MSLWTFNVCRETSCRWFLLCQSACQQYKHRWIYKQTKCAKQKNYRHHFISNFIGEYVISLTYKIICNSIGDLFHINERQNPSVINILSVAFHVMFFNFLELFDILSLSVILSVMCLIYFFKKIQINRIEKNLKK